MSGETTSEDMKDGAENGVESEAVNDTSPDGASEEVPTEDQEASPEEDSNLDSNLHAQSAAARLEAELADMKNKYLYAVAELDNVRKRHLKERSELLRYAGENMARDLLEVLDDLERLLGSPDAFMLKPREQEGAEGNSEGAEDKPSSTHMDPSALIEGITIISNRMRTLFERFGIVSEDALGGKFDPNKHEALTMVPSADAEPGTIVQQIKKPYFFKDKLLRPGQVIVAGE